MLSAELLRGSALLTALFAAAACDIKMRKLPNKVLFMGFLLTGAVNMIFPPDISPFPVLCTLALTGLLLLMRRLRLIGGGDIKLFWLIIWACPGWKGSAAVLLSFPIMLISGTILFLKNGQRSFPTGPCVMLSAAAGLVLIR